MTWPDIMEHWIADTLLTGNGLLEIERGGNGQVSGLIYHPWGTVTVQELPSGRLRYDVSQRQRQLTALARRRSAAPARPHE